MNKLGVDGRRSGYSSSVVDLGMDCDYEEVSGTRDIVIGNCKYCRKRHVPCLAVEQMICLECDEDA